MGVLADGSIKRMVNSKTVNVPDITILAQFLHHLRHFQLRGTSLALLNEALEILELKTIHIMTFCTTSMNYLLQTFSVCDILTTADIKKEQ